MHTNKTPALDVISQLALNINSLEIINANSMTDCGKQSIESLTDDSTKTLTQLDSEPYLQVKRGESFELHQIADGIPTPLNTPKVEVHIAAFTDYLNITFPFKASPEAFLELENYFDKYIGQKFNSLKLRRSGFLGYKNSFEIGQTTALFAYGGQRETGFISFPGSACALINDWHGCIHLLRDILKGRITRWDGAVDVFDGNPSVDDAVKFYLEGQFNAGGNKVKISQQGNWLEPDGSGRTLYIGLRKNGKMLRVYEKGKQLGDPKSPWTRWELELHSRDRIIPWEVLLKPDDYIAAAYPCMHWVSGTQERIRTTQMATTISYEHAIYHASRGYGQYINTMLEVEGTAEKVIERLKRDGVPRRLDCGDSLPSEFIMRKNGKKQD